MQFSVWPNMTNAPSEALDTARWADANGWYGVWYADHYMPNTGTEEIKRGETYECWAMLPAIAAATRKVRVGSLVSPTSIHHPAVLANRAATIDHLSNGRMVLGLGAGWQINEHQAYGIELERPGARVQRFDEAIQIIRSLLTEELTTFEGEVFSITAAPSDPKPIQSPLPLLVGTSSPRMLRITARHADEWNTWGHLDEARTRRDAFETACAAVGRDPASMHTSVQALVYLTDDRTVIDKVLAGPFGDRAIGGSAAYLVDAIGRYAEMGFAEFIVPTFNLGPDPSARLEAIERIDQEVIRQL